MEQIKSYFDMLHWHIFQEYKWPWMLLENGAFWVSYFFLNVIETKTSRVSTVFVY